MPVVPTNAVNMTPSPLAQPTSPENYLMAAANMASNGEFQSAPVPTGHTLEQPAHRMRRRIKVVK